MPTEASAEAAQLHKKISVKIRSGERLMAVFVTGIVKAQRRALARPLERLVEPSQLRLQVFALSE